MDKQNKNWQLPFFTIWTGQQISLLGSMLASFALIWWVTKTTGLATTLAMLTLVQMLPRVILGPFAGALVDRWNRRAVMIVADSIVALFSAWLAYLFWTHSLSMWHIYVIMTVRAVGGTFHWTAMSASTSLMVPQEQLARVAGINQTTQGLWSIVSPPLGALLMSLLPLHGIMGIDVITAGLALVPLFFVDIPQPQRQQRATSAQAVARPSLWQDVREGLLYIWQWPGLRAILIMAAFINFLLTPASALMPLMVTQHFGGEVLQLSWMESAWGGGVVIGGLTLSVWGGFKRRIVTSMLGLMGLGLGALIVGLAPATALWLAVGAMFLLGVMNPLTNGPINAIFQSLIPPDMQGRTFTVIGSASSAMAPLGMAIAGPTADHLGVGAWYVLGGIMCMLMGVIGFFTPSIMHIEDHQHQPNGGD